jgi:hypothetical protein
LAHCVLTGWIPQDHEVPTAPSATAVSSQSTLVAALQSVGAELDVLASRVQQLATCASGEGPVSIACQGACPRAERYRAAVRDAIHALERTRTSFKSKELGALRRSLETLLFEEMP